MRAFLRDALRVEQDLGARRTPQSWVTRFVAVVDAIPTVEMACPRMVKAFAQLVPASLIVVVTFAPMDPAIRAGVLARAAVVVSFVRVCSPRCRCCRRFLRW